MFINSLILAISSSIDSLGIGITYGIKNTKITFLAKIVLFIISFSISIVSIWFGNGLKYILPDFIVRNLGGCILVAMGFFIFFQSFKKNKKDFSNPFNQKIDCHSKEEIYSFFIKFLGITIKIIKNPSYSDLDKSNTIDSKEALFLGLALSLDSFCIGIGFSMISVYSLFFPFFISFFQLIFLNLGIFLGNKLYNFKKIPDNIWSIVSGILLVIIGIVKLI